MLAAFATIAAINAAAVSVEDAKAFNRIMQSASPQDRIAMQAARDRAAALAQEERRHRELCDAIRSRNSGPGFRTGFFFGSMF